MRREQTEIIHRERYKQAMSQHSDGGQEGERRQARQPGRRAEKAGDQKARPQPGTQAEKVYKKSSQEFGLNAKHNGRRATERDGGKTDRKECIKAIWQGGGKGEHIV